MRTNNGAFQISRSIYDSEIWMKPPEWLKVWIYLLGRVNFEDNNLFKRGENLFNYQVIAIECGVSYNIVNKCINFLKSAKQVSTQKTTRGVVLAINNYDTYQDLSSYRQNRSKTEAKQKQNESYTITEQGNNETMKQGNIETVSKDTGEQALVVEEKKEIENIDHRNSGTQRIIEIIKDQVQQEGYLYDNNPEERRRATIIAKRQSDWGDFIKETPEDQEERIIRSIISYSNQNEYSAKIRSGKDFHEKWKKVANTMKQAVKKDTHISHIPTY